MKFPWQDERSDSPSRKERGNDMSETRHTPGPWATCNTTIYAVDDGEPVARCLDKEMHRAFPDAQLIAAAPELLAACELALLDMDSWGIFGPGRKAIETAIKKAKGE